MILHTILTSKTGPAATRAHLLRRTLGSSFFGALVPLVYYYLQHKQHRVAGGEYIMVLVCARFEWSVGTEQISTNSLLDLRARRVVSHHSRRRL